MLIFLLVMAAYALVRVRRNKSEGKKIWDNRLKAYVVWMIFAAISLLSYGIIGLDFDLYLGEFLIMVLLVLAAFYAGLKFRIFAVWRSLWIGFSVAAVIFAILFSIRLVDFFHMNAAYANDGSIICSARTFF
ncbi:MAG TPA: hypothetical protein VF817_01410 [Patescibacteria group bacterium]